MSKSMASVTTHRNYRDTIKFYKELREAVHEFIEDEYRYLGIRASEITHLDACTADRWKCEGSRAFWQWQQMYADYHTHAGVKRFDLAIKLHGVLQLLCYGVPSRRKLILKMHAIERSPVRYTLEEDAVEIALLGALTYADLLRSKEIWLCNPVSPAHVRYYRQYGFTPHHDAAGLVPYLTMRLNTDE